MHARRFVAALAAVFLVSGWTESSGPGLLPAAAAAQPPRSPAPSSTPIFYYESQMGALLVRAVHPDGRSAEVDVESSAGLPVWSPEGSWFAFVSGDSTGSQISIGNLQGTRRVVERSEGLDEAFAPPLHWSPDGKAIAALAFSAPPEGVSVVVLDALGGGLPERYRLPATAATLWTEEPITLRWSPDGRKILLASHEAYAIELSSGAVDTLSHHLILPTWRPESDGIYYLDVEGEPDSSATSGGLFAAGEPDGEVQPTVTGFYFKPLGGGEPIRLAGAALVDSLGLGAWKFVGMDDSPDGERLALWSTRLGQAAPELQGTVRIYDLRGPGRPALEKPTRTLTLDQTFISSLQWGSEEDRLAAAVARLDHLEIALLDTRTGKLETLRELAADETIGMAFLHFIQGSVLSWVN
jgi:WD40 repeat protein